MEYYEQESTFPSAVVDWVKENPDHVESWMTDPEFRRRLLATPEEFGLTGDAGDWVQQRIQNRGIERLAGEQPGHIVAM